MKSLKPVVLTVLVVALCACVQPRSIVTHRAADDTMSCTQIARRMGELMAIKQLTLTQVNSRNIAAGILFFPAISANRDNVRTTLENVNKRQNVLTSLYQAKDCRAIIPRYTKDQIERMIADGEVWELQ